jgi:benzoyl-CoA 2,3-dioxygenase component B
LFGADESSNAATFYSSGLKGRYEEGKRGDDHILKGNSYKILSVEDGKLVEKLEIKNIQYSIFLS